MAKQMAIIVSINEIADWLIKEHGFPSDIEVCYVAQVPGTTSVVVTIHSDIMDETPRSCIYRFNSLERIKRVLKGEESNE